VGHVVDFIHVFGFPAIFNIADICIVSSMGLFIILTIRGIGFDGKKIEKMSKREKSAMTTTDASTGLSPADKGAE
jgi:signal peptidase II